MGIDRRTRAKHQDFSVAQITASATSRREPPDFFDTGEINLICRLGVLPSGSGLSQKTMRVRGKLLDLHHRGKVGAIFGAVATFHDTHLTDSPLGTF
jgi:hypothetical protein